MSIQIRNLYKSFHDNQVLRNVDLDVKEREIVVLMGLASEGTRPHGPSSLVPGS